MNTNPLLPCAAVALLLCGASASHALELSAAPQGLRVVMAEPVLPLATPAAAVPDRMAWLRERFYALSALPSLPPLQLRLNTSDLVTRVKARGFSVFHAQSQADLNWQPLSLGVWRLGAVLGMSKDLPNPAARTQWATFPMATYEGDQVRVNLGLLPPRGTRETTLLMRFTVPLR